MTTIYILPDAARYPKAASALWVRGSEESIPDLGPPMSAVRYQMIGGKLCITVPIGIAVEVDTALPITPLITFGATRDPAEDGFTLLDLWGQIYDWCPDWDRWVEVGEWVVGCLLRSFVARFRRAPA